MCDQRGGLLRSNRLTNDGRELFVKISYLFRARAEAPELEAQSAKHKGPEA
jgi:hypothetical protein